MKTYNHHSLQNWLLLLNAPHFSVIVPNYNHGRYLHQRLTSVLQQTCPNFEVIILDDASTDNSREIISQFKDHEKISIVDYNEANSGSPFLQWKKGLALARHEWIWFAESDDVSDLNFLQTASDYIEQHHFDIFYTDAFFIDGDGNIFNQASAVKNKFFNTNRWSEDYVNDGTREVDQYLKFLGIINNANAMVVRKSLAAAIIDRSAAFKYYGDWVFYINACCGGRIAYCAKPLSSYRTHAANHVHVSNNVSLTKPESFKILRLLLSLPFVTGKKDLIHFFALNYLGFGLVKEGLLRGIAAFKQYGKIDASLARTVIKKVILNKMTFKKTDKEFP